MEQILANLLVADNDVIQKATLELQEAFKRPETIPTLCDIAVSSKSSQIRQYAAVLLRRRLSKQREWQLVPKEQQQIIKNGMLNSLLAEPEKSVRNAITRFIGVLVRHEFGKNDPWMTDVLKFIFGNCSSSEPNLAELGSSTFSVLTDVAPDQFIPHMEDTCNMFCAALMASEAAGNMATPVMYNLLNGVAHLVPFTVNHNIAENTYQKSIPYVVKCLQGFATQDSEKFVNAFDILENLAEYSTKLLTQHIKLLIEFCLELSHNVQLDEPVRIKAISYIGWLVRLKKKLIIKQKLVEPIILALFKLMASASELEDDDEEEYFIGNNEFSSPMTCATQTMDLLALHIPPEKLIPPLWALLEPAMKTDDPLQKKASYLCMAVIAEGCSDTICSKYLRPLLDCVKTGITDANPTVRNAALFALGQFSEHLQPDISKYSTEILPILFEFLHQLCEQIRSGAFNDGSEPKYIDRMFYALDTFCENLEDLIVPHLPVLMKRLLEALDARNTVHLRELALGTVSAAANAAKENMMPYFPRLIEELKLYLIKTEDENICTLRSHAIDTLATIARTIGKENFFPFAVDTMNMGLSFLEEIEDPELRRACYNLFASMAEVLTVEIGSALPKIVERMLESVKSTQGIVTEYKEEEEEIIDMFNLNQDNNADGNIDEEFDIEHSDGEEEDDEDIAAFSVENAFMDEKEEAIIALREIALYAGPAFGPFIQPCFEEIYKLVNYPQEDIRKASIEALTQFVLSLHLLNNPEATTQTLLFLIPKLSEIIRTDDERAVVMAALDSFSEILQKLKSVAVQADGQKDAIFGCIFEVLSGKVLCQFNDPIVDEDHDEDSEYDEAIIETAGDILPRLGGALTSQEFALYFGRAWPLLIQKIEKSKKSEATDSSRAFSIGVIAECFNPLKECCSTWVPSLMPILVAGAQDRNDEVRSNSVFALGEMVLNADEYTYTHYPQILQVLSAAVAKEQHPGTLDNICGALARLIITNASLVPLKQVLPVFVQYLPLREDFEENTSVFKSIDVLYRQGNETLVEQMERIIFVALQILYQKQYSTEETRDLIFAFIKQTRQDFPDKFTTVAGADPEVATFVQTLFA